MTGPLPEGAPITAPAPSPAPVDRPAEVEPPPIADRGEFELGLPEQPWAVRWTWAPHVNEHGQPLTQLTRGEDDVAADGTARTAMALDGRAVLTLWLKRAPSGATNVRVLADRTFAELELRARSPLEDVQRWERGEITWIQFRLPTIRGMPVQRVERHGIAWRDGWAIHLAAWQDHADADWVARLDAWSQTVAVVARDAPPGAEALTFARALWRGDGDDAIARAIRQLDRVVADWRALPAERQREAALFAAEAYVAVDRAAEAEAFVRAVREGWNDPPLHYAHAKLCAVLGRVEDWAASVRAAYAGGGAELPDPRDEPAFLTIPAEPFEAAMQAIGR